MSLFLRQSSAIVRFGPIPEGWSGLVVMTKMKKTYLRLGWVIISIALTVCFGGSLYLYRQYQQIPAERAVGNRPSSLKALKETGLPFSFLVMGDIQSSERAGALIESALKDGNPSFMILLGDFVKEPGLWNHRLFLTEMTVETRPPFPVFMVPGNHDIDHGSSGHGKQTLAVTGEVYESLYGGRSFDFSYNGCLFILCGVDFNRPEEYLAYLQDTLSKRGQGKRHVFVFIHYPPKGLAPYIEGSLPFGEKFLSLVEAHQVTACFFGDFHGYWRGERNGVNLIVSGGGGRLKETQPEWGKFHHILRMTVGQEGVSESLIVSPREFSVEDQFRHVAFTLLFPIVDSRGLTLYGLLTIFLFSSLFAILFLIRSLRRRPEPRSGCAG